jgi:hypothetical protein
LNNTWLPSFDWTKDYNELVLNPGEIYSWGSLADPKLVVGKNIRIVRGPGSGPNPIIYQYATYTGTDGKTYGHPALNLMRGHRGFYMDGVDFDCAFQCYAINAPTFFDFTLRNSYVINGMGNIKSNDGPTNNVLIENVGNINPINEYGIWAATAGGGATGGAITHANWTIRRWRFNKSVWAHWIRSYETRNWLIEDCVTDGLGTDKGDCLTCKNGDGFIVKNTIFRGRTKVGPLSSGSNSNLGMRLNNLQFIGCTFEDYIYFEAGVTNCVVDNCKITSSNRPFSIQPVYLDRPVATIRVSNTAATYTGSNALAWADGGGGTGGVTWAGGNTLNGNPYP